MNALILALLPAAIGVDYGWERKPDGTIEYVIQIEPEAVDAMKTGSELISDLPRELRNITTYKIKIGRDRLPNHNQLPPELQNTGYQAPATNPAYAGAPPSPFPTQSTSTAGPLYGSTSNPAAANPNRSGYTPTTATGTAPTSTGNGWTNSSTQPAQPTTTGGYATQPPQQYDQFGRPIMPMASAPTTNSPTQYDQFGRPIQPTPAYTAQPTQAQQYDQYGRPIPPTQQYDQFGRPIILASTGQTLPTGTPTSTAGFPMTGTTGYTTQPTYGASGAYNPNYAQPYPNYQQNPGYQQPYQTQPSGAFVSNTQPGGYASPQYGTGQNFNPNEGPRLTDASGTPTYASKPPLGDGTAVGGNPNFVNTGANNGQPNQGIPPTGMQQPGMNEPRSPNDNRNASSQQPSTTTNAESPDRFWPLTMALVCLFGSFGANLYFGWTTYHLRERYRMLLSDRTPAY